MLWELESQEKGQRVAFMFASGLNVYVAHDMLVHLNSKGLHGSLDLPTTMSAGVIAVSIQPNVIGSSLSWPSKFSSIKMEAVSIHILSEYALPTYGFFQQLV